MMKLGLLQRLIHKIEEMYDMAEEIVEVKEAKPSLLGIITNPTEQFERIRKRPVFWGALLIVVIISMIGLWFTSLGVELPEFEGLSEEEIAVGKVIGGISVMLLGIVTTVISILFSTVLYLLIARVNRSDVKFKQLFSMHTYIMLITALSIAINGIIIAALGDSYGANDSLFTSIGAYVNAEGPMAVLLDHIEIFGIWTLILTAIGLQKVAHFTKSQAWIVALVFFVVGMIFAMTNVEASGLMN